MTLSIFLEQEGEDYFSLYGTYSMWLFFFFLCHFYSTLILLMQLVFVGSFLNFLRAQSKQTTFFVSLDICFMGAVAALLLFNPDGVRKGTSLGLLWQITPASLRAGMLKLRKWTDAEIITACYWHRDLNWLGFLMSLFTFLKVLVLFFFLAVITFWCEYRWTNLKVEQ